MPGLSEDAVRAALAAMPGAGATSVTQLDAAAVAAALQQVTQRPLGEILALRESIMADSGRMGQISVDNPPMWEALQNPDPQAFVDLIHKIDEHKREQDAERQR